MNLFENVENCGTSCAISQIAKEAKKYDDARGDIPPATVRRDEGFRRKLETASKYLGNHPFSRKKLLDTSELYRSNMKIRNPNALGNLNMGGEEYSDLIEREQYLNDFAKDLKLTL